MPVEETTNTKIVCDNPDCPGNELDPANRYGWLFVTHEIYGEPTQSHVFCSSDCVSAVTRDATNAIKMGFSSIKSNGG
jgi:hypothetical protein